MEGEEKIGYHKGALESLVNERTELLRLLKIVETLIQYHASNMQQAGVDPKKFLEEIRDQKVKMIEGSPEPQEDNNPVDEFEL